MVTWGISESGGDSSAVQSQLQEVKQIFSFVEGRGLGFRVLVEKWKPVSYIGVI